MTENCEAVEKENNSLQEKTFKFAIMTVNLCKYLRDEMKELVISNQMLKSGTSVCANYQEACFSESRADRKHKASIALKEAVESIYWIKLLLETECDYEGLEEMLILATEIKHLLMASIKTMNQKLSNQKVMKNGKNI